MEHPLAKFRDSHHLSQDDLANLAGITRQIITLTEQGVYPTIPPAIIKALKYEFGPLATRGLQESHEEWIHRELDAVDVRPLMHIEMNHIEPDRLPVGVNSFVQWRNLISDSVSAFGKLVKIQPVTIRKYESGATHNLPVQLVDRLKDWGFSEAYIDAVANLPIHGSKKNGNGR